MKGSKSTSRTNVANNRQATAASAHTQPERPKREAEAAPVDAQTRHEMIAVAAYRLAECRGFAAGCELDDWCCAEAEIDAKLKRNPGLVRLE